MEEVIKFFANEGILGMIIIVLGFVIGWQEKQKSDCRKEVALLNKELNLLSDKRVEDIRSSQALTFSSLETLKDADYQRTEKLKSVLDNVLTVVQNLQSIIQFGGKK